MEIDEYIRTPKGKLGKVIRIWKCKDRKRYLIDWGNGKATYISQIKNIKHSKDIIDLIQVGDFVNGNKVIKIECGCYAITSEKTACNLNKSYTDYQIKSIVTHEQFKEMEYRL